MQLAPWLVIGDSMRVASPNEREQAIAERDGARRSILQHGYGTGKQDGGYLILILFGSNFMTMGIASSAGYWPREKQS